ncbi:YfiR family protein [Methylomonas sp. MED-D]|nr:MULTISPECIES: YfiR family protein [Methylomonas]MDT4331490.1 YfiR family protein [Methylomonas sp. MV1]NJA05314.1 DUF4154 domain-containing protein [Methylococcaceae bacterium WWC4]WGS84379.1 YfiR family protein [Methylomonas sp. UP202]
MSNITRTCAIAVMLGYLRIASGEPVAFEQYAVLAALTLNFARFTQWPDQAFTDSDNQLKVCLVGDNVLLQSFDSINGKAVGNKAIKTLNSEKLRNLNQCHILFISEISNSLLSQVFLDIQNRRILTIGESLDFVNAGGMVAMLNVDGKIQLYVNNHAVKAAGLAISSNLLRLAKIVGEN